MASSPVKVEVCIDSVAGARAAEAAGADRVELCSSLVEGGITPSYGLIQQVQAVLANTKLMVLIRPRGGDFVYTADEINVMLADIGACKGLGAHGVVVGCLQPDGTVDVTATRRLVREAQGLQLEVTFHRAFDVSKDLSHNLEVLIELGIQRVLTSGGSPTALQGSTVIAALVKQAAGRITKILAGGGVRSSNTAELIAATGVCEVHSSAKRPFESSMQFRRPGMSLCAPTPPSDFTWSVTDESEVKQLVNTARGTNSQAPS